MSAIKAKVKSMFHVRHRSEPTGDPAPAPWRPGFDRKRSPSLAVYPRMVSSVPQPLSANIHSNAIPSHIVTTKLRRIASLERSLAAVRAQARAVDEETARLTTDVKRMHAEIALLRSDDRPHRSCMRTQAEDVADVSTVSVGVAAGKVIKLERVVTLLLAVVERVKLLEGDRYVGSDAEGAIVDAIVASAYDDPSGPWAKLKPLIIGPVPSEAYVWNIHAVLAARKELHQLRKMKMFWKDRARINRPYADLVKPSATSQGPLVQMSISDSLSVVSAVDTTHAVKEDTSKYSDTLRPTSTLVPNTGIPTRPRASQVGSLPSFVKSTDIVFGFETPVLDDIVRSVCVTPSTSVASVSSASNNRIFLPSPASQPRTDAFIAPTPEAEDDWTPCQPRPALCFSNNFVQSNAGGTKGLSRMRNDPPGVSTSPPEAAMAEDTVNRRASHVDLSSSLSSWSTGLPVPPFQRHLRNESAFNPNLSGDMTLSPSSASTVGLKTETDTKIKLPVPRPVFPLLPPEKKTRYMAPTTSSLNKTKGKAVAHELSPPSPPALEFVALTVPRSRIPQSNRTSAFARLVASAVPRSSTATPFRAMHLGARTMETRSQRRVTASPNAQ